MLHLSETMTLNNSSILKSSKEFNNYIALGVPLPEILLFSLMGESQVQDYLNFST